MGKIDLTSLEWRELVFQGKNKEYGAYVMRKDSSKRHTRSTMIVCVAAVIVFSIPKLMTLLKKDEVEKVEYGPTVMSKLPPAEVKDEHIKKVETTAPPPALKTAVKFTAPVIAKDEEVSDADELRSQDEISNTKGIISIADVKGNDEVGGLDIADVKENVVQVEEEPVLDVVAQMPTFPGGDAELLKYISDHLKYPVVALENGIQGQVMLRFVVTKTGAIGDVQILRSLDPACDKEAIRVVKSLPDFIPGKQNGAAVSVWFNLPIRFRLD